MSLRLLGPFAGLVAFVAVCVGGIGSGRPAVDTLRRGVGMLLLAGAAGGLAGEVLYRNVERARDRLRAEEEGAAEARARAETASEEGDDAPGDPEQGEPVSAASGSERKDATGDGA